MTPTGDPLRKGTGVTGRNTIIHGGGQVTAGLFDDPFFFDLNAFNLFKAQARLSSLCCFSMLEFMPESVPPRRAFQVGMP